jgi:hypothetical protein
MVVINRDKLIIAHDNVHTCHNNGLYLVKDEFTLQSDKNPQDIDEAVWQAWLEKNNAQDRFRYERRLRVLAVGAALLTVSALLWRFAG